MARVEQEWQAVGVLAQHHQPGRIFMRFGAWRGAAARESSIRGKGAV